LQTVTGSGRKVHNFYILPYGVRMTKLRRIRREAHVMSMREKSNAYRILVDKYGGKRPLG